MGIREYILKHWQLICLLTLSLLVIWPLFIPGYFSHHDDLQVMRVYEMRKCLQDLQIPCRWVPDMGYGNGYPLFNYYGVLPYYIGAFLSFVFGYIISAKLLFLIPLVMGFLSMYFLAKELFGPNSAFLAAVLFGFTPYRALDSYVRGDVDEIISLSLIPLVFYFALKLMKLKSRKYLFLFVISFFIFLTTHNIMTLFFTPILFLWLLYWLKNYPQSIFLTLWGSVLALGLSCFFLIPAYFEKELVQTENLIKFNLDFRAHFITVRELFLDRFWGYGASIPGGPSTISYQVGWPLWWLVVISIVVILFRTIFTKEKNILFYLFLIIFALASLMTLNRSAFIWEKIPLLAYVQFPWRFLAVIIFAGSLLAVWWLNFVSKKMTFILTVFVAILTVLLNFSFFRPETFYYNLTDWQKLSGYSFQIQQKAAILDYLPKGAIEAKEPAPNYPIITSGNATISNFFKNSNSFSFQSKVDKEASFELPIYDFPNWTLYLDGAKTPHSHKNVLQRVNFTLGSGSYNVYGRLENTSIRTWANFLTLVSLVGLIITLKYGQHRKVFS